MQTGYTATGYPQTLTRTSDGTVYAIVKAMDAWGHATRIVEGNGVTLVRGYDAATGLALSTDAQGPNHAQIAELRTLWDGFGNLTTRDDLKNGSQEAETYDRLNRLKTTTLTLAGGGSLIQSFTYDDTGNRTQACANGTCTTYGYGASHGLLPHAVTSVDGDATGYAYDANGEMTSDADRSLSWTAFGKAATITKPSGRSAYQVSLAYGPDEARYRKQLAISGATAETVTYLEAAEVLTVSGHTSIRRSLSLAGIGTIDTGGYNARVLYPVTDNLGSVVALSDGGGNLAVQMSYGPFGRRKTAGWAAYMTIGQALAINEDDTDRGYTGQEALDAVQLDDYNARLYDPSLGRFLSTDPLISHPGSTQSINPYSYVENNPLNRTDPTGEVDAMSQSCGGVASHLCDNGGSWDDTHPTQYNVSFNYTNGSSVTLHGTAAQLSGVKISDVGKLANTFSEVQKAISANAKTDPNKHNYSGKDPASAGGDQSNLNTVIHNWLGKAPSGMVHVSTNGDTSTINITGRVAGDKNAFKTLNAGVNKFFNNVSFKWNGHTILINTHLTFTNKLSDILNHNYDFMVEPEFSRASNAELGDVDRSTMRMSLMEGIGITHEEALESAAHEFGHILGFGDAYKPVGGGYGEDLPGFEHDIMGVGSPEGGNQVQAWDAEALLREYGP